MTTSVTDAASGPYFPNGATVEFPFTFKVADESEVSAIRIDAFGATTLIPSSDYAVTLGVDGEGGFIRCSVPPVNDGRQLWLVSNPLFTQEILFEDEGPFNSAVLNPLADRAAIRDIWLKARLDRAILMPFGESPSPLPAAAGRAGRFFGFDAGGALALLSGTGSDAALRTDLAAAGGTELAGFKSRVANSILRTALDKLDESVSVMDFIPESERAAIRNHTSTYDCTDAFNAALEAAAVYSGNDTYLKRAVKVPRGTYVIGGGNKTIFVRKGQHLQGEGLGCYLNCLSTFANTKPLIRLGAGSLYENTPGGDPGGMGAQISGFWVLGGPASVGVVDTSQQAGWWIDHMFFTACGIGVYCSGGDGLLSNCQFDLGLTCVSVIQAGNVTIWGCNFYDNNYGVQLNDYSRDVEINGCHFEYQHYCSIFIGPGSTAATNCRGIAIRGNSFLQNVQHTTFLGYVCVSGSNTEVEILGGNTFRNCYGPAVRSSIGTGNKMVIVDALFDGKRTFTDPVYGYTQSTTMIGVDASNMDVTVKGCVFRNLPAQPILVGGVVETRLSVAATKFDGNTGGTSEISITNAVLTSRVDLANIEGGDRLLFNPQQWVAVTAQGLKRWLDAPVVGGARTSVKVPVSRSQILGIAVKANLQSGGSVDYRKSSRFICSYGQDYDGANPVTRTYLVEQIAFPNISGNPAFLPKIDLQTEINAVGGGTSVNGHANLGYVAVSWPNSYTNVGLDVQLEV